MGFGALPMDRDDVAPSGRGGERLEVPGDFQVKIIEVIEGDANGKLVVDFEVISGDPGGYEGCAKREWYDPPGPDSEAWRVNILIKLAIATGLVSEEQTTAAQEAGEQLDIDWMEMLDRPLCIRMVRSKKNEKYVNVVDMFPCDDPKAKGIPMERPTRKPSKTKKPDSPANEENDDLF